jgi:hypothetical protein
MSITGPCDWLLSSASGFACKLRNQNLPKAEVSAKCANSDLPVICIDAYSSLARGQEAIDSGSTDAFPYLIDSASHFEGLQELDNAVMAYVKGINFAAGFGLIDKGYEMFRLARTLFENGVLRSDPSLKSPGTKQILVKAGQGLIDSARKKTEQAPVIDVHAELKATILGGFGLRKAEKKESKDIVGIGGQQLYGQKAQEYRDSAETYVKSGMVKSAVVFACMAALADLMLGKAADGMAYLAKIAADSGQPDKFNENPCFQWTKLVFKAHVGKDVAAIQQAQTQFLQIPWGFKDDREFARRVMDATARRITE